MTKQLSLEKEPSSLAEVLYQPAIINTLRRYISEEEAMPQAMYFHGPPGTGKTSTAKAFIKSLRCLDKAVGSSNPCGKCRICKSTEDVRFSHPSSNVMWIQRGASDQQMKSQIDEITEYIKYPPEFGGKYKFVVVDELQTLNISHIFNFLLLSESGPARQNNVIFIFITMSHESLQEVTREALVSRTLEFPFVAPAEDMILEYLKKQYEYPEASLRIIARESDRNLRRTYALMQRVLDNDPSKAMDPIVTANTLNVADDDKRIKLWSLIQKGSYGRGKQITLFVKSLLEEGTMEKSLIKDMIEDIQFCVEQQEDEENLVDQFKAMTKLCEYLSSSAPIPITAFFFLFSMKGYKAVNIDLLKSRHSKANGFSTLTEAN